MKFCRFCGKKVPQDSKFCDRCGKQLDGDAFSTFREHIYDEDNGTQDDKNRHSTPPFTPVKSKNNIISLVLAIIGGVCSILTLIPYVGIFSFIVSMICCIFSKVNRKEFLKTEKEDVFTSTAQLISTIGIGIAALFMIVNILVIVGTALDFISCVSKI